MKKIIFAVLISIPVSAQQMPSVDCQKQALQVGTTRAQLDQECIDDVLKNPTASAQSKDGLILIVGLGNILLIHHQDTLKNILISGSRTQLKNIDALIFDEVAQEVSIVDHAQKKTLVFNISLSGNLSPKRVLNH